MSWGQGCVRVPRLTCDLDVSHLVRLLTFIVGVPGRYNAQSLGKQSKDWDGVGRGLWMLTVETTNKICELVFCQPQRWVGERLVLHYTIQRQIFPLTPVNTNTHRHTHRHTLTQSLSGTPILKPPRGIGVQNGPSTHPICLCATAPG